MDVLRAYRLPMLLILAVATFEPIAARAATCDDDAAVAALVEDARGACPCASFDRRTAFRRCVRQRITAAVRAGTLGNRCRGRVAKMANRTTCGDLSSAVTCCATLPSGREACTIASSGVACGFWRGGTGRIGASDWCHDACLPAPTPSVTTTTPTPSVTPSGPTGLGPHCFCACAPPEPVRTPSSGCPGLHGCIVPSVVPAGTADCDAFDDVPRRQCTYQSDGPVPDPVHGPFIDICDF